jgi:hypothetical protein
MYYKQGVPGRMSKVQCGSNTMSVTYTCVNSGNNVPASCLCFSENTLQTMQHIDPTARRYNTRHISKKFHSTQCLSINGVLKSNVKNWEAYLY